MSNTSLPFKNNNTHKGLTIIEGALRITDNALIFEFITKISDNALIIGFTTKDSMLEALKPEIKQVEVAFEDIEYINFKKSIFGNKLVIRLSNFALAQKLPVEDVCMVQLQIARKDKKTAALFVSKTQRLMSDYHYKTSEAHYRDELSRAIDQA